MGFLDIITFLSITITYFIYSSVNGFSDIIEKCLKVKGNVNLVINSILFMLLIRLVINNVPMYLNMMEIIFNRLLYPSKLTEGQNVVSEDDQFAINALTNRIDNLHIIIKRNYKKHDNMIESKEKDEIFNRIMREQVKVDKLILAKTLLITS